MNSPKIIVYSPYAPSAPGAAGMRVKAIQDALERENARVTILTPRDGREWSIFQRIQDEKPSTIIATSPPLPPLAWVWFAAKVSGSRFILDAKDDGRALALLSKKNNSWKEIMYLQLRAFLYKNADRIWFLTQSDKEEARQRYHLSESRTAIVPNGCDERITFSTVLRKKIRSEWNVSPRRMVLLYAGSLGDEDIHGFVQATQKIRDNYHLIFVATVDNTTQDRARRDALHAQLNQKEQSYHFYENISPSELSAIFSGADIGIVPWSDDLPSSIPVKTFDYAGTGLPILAKCPPSGELHALLENNKEWGDSIASWDAFPRAFARTLRRFSLSKYTLKQRAVHAKRVQETWGRRKRIQREMSRVIDMNKNQS
ncbi:MAG: glycosyltransferase family 4 protein [Candidatus Diapherotrites archaeon]|uniref:Glycosyltransferase family 4 protein n=1 Tax=Candidatus Iainarchaeum sp. TaxID=3101447 RepID=A0A8T4C6F1_9ARCH|nr:glycosyltransferase family 4 protein [Candidatus Diapherotrites archaeon]